MKNALQIDDKYLPSISKFFSSGVLDSLIVQNNSAYLDEVCQNSGLLKNFDANGTVGDFFDYAYGVLLKTYKNEYIYKNVLTHKILLGKHSLNTSQMLMELRVGNSIADVVLLNGSSTVYEIKSDYDSMNRIETQMSAYRDAFDFINVITTIKQADRVKKIVHDDVGILILSDRNTISTYREAKSNIQNIKLSVLFDSLRKTEYTQIIKKYYGEIPQVPNTKINSVCKEMFCQIPQTEAHWLWVDILKTRKKSLALQNYISDAPHSMAANLINTGYRSSSIVKISNLFNEELDKIVRFDVTNKNEICTTLI